MGELVGGIGFERSPSVLQIQSCEILVNWGKENKLVAAVHIVVVLAVDIVVVDIVAADSPVAHTPANIRVRLRQSIADALSPVAVVGVGCSLAVDRSLAVDPCSILGSTLRRAAKDVSSAQGC